MTYRDKFIVKPRTRVKLRDIDPDFAAGHESHHDARSDLAADRKQLAELQYLLYAEKKRSVLVVLQAIDAGGKDGTVNHVLSAMNPQGCSVVGFKEPSAEELAHDFLWRIHKRTPKAGEIVVFNRSHYEDVLIARVHDLVPKAVWSKRYALINDFERLLAANGTHILKFFLHISKDEQLARFKARLDDKTKNWKISESDYTERKYWDDYMAAFDDALSKCSTRDAPWFVIPANHKWFRNLAVARIICETLCSLGMKTPGPGVDLDEIRRKYHQAKIEQKHGRA
jgi:PPK2 family polyphosphate:nucleotide phosphotransferase